MSSAPFDISLIVARLQALDPQPFTTIGTVVEYSKITDLNGFSTPSAYVLMGPEQGEPGTGRAQVASMVFGVAIAVRNYSSDAALALAHESHPLIGQVRDQLIGFLPSKFHTTPVQWLRGDVLDYDAGTLVWMDTFQTKRVIGGMRCQK
ncbi:hypothetical protein IG611_15295 [Pectobacterium sp. A535-S3-A17]|uniref:phage tail terminator protein n=1 Tax=Pectobacterium TaxID=122277 RepID=UPI001874EB26|nr:hypothetical protein [Pectobacterium quasiaquaticum]MBE5226709.1 hypothetical protein [Pectobacterium quasiaquaticum]